MALNSVAASGIVNKQYNLEYRISALPLHQQIFLLGCTFYGVRLIKDDAVEALKKICHSRDITFYDSTIKNTMEALVDMNVLELEDNRVSVLSPFAQVK